MDGIFPGRNVETKKHKGLRLQVSRKNFMNKTARTLDKQSFHLESFCPVGLMHKFVGQICVRPACKNGYGGIENGPFTLIKDGSRPTRHRDRVIAMLDRYLIIEGGSARF